MTTATKQAQRTPDFVAVARGMNSLTTERDALRAALRAISELGDKTLICVSDEHGQKCYSDGAHNAFAQCAGIALAALAKAES